jgi:hypothetical protein
MLKGRKALLSRQFLWLVPVILATSFLFYSCAPDSGFNSVDDYDVVITLYESGVDFATFLTFIMPDSIVHLGDSTDINMDYDGLILTEVEDQFEACGYTVELNPDVNPPDFVVLVSTVSTDWLVYYGYDWWYYWGWYPGWGYYPYYGAGWGMYYPPYWGGYTTSYSTGTILIEMVNASDPIEENELLPVVWTAAINGLLEGTTSQMQSRIEDSISQAFAQSPYLKIN